MLTVRKSREHQVQTWVEWQKPLKMISLRKNGINNSQCVLVRKVYCFFQNYIWIYKYLYVFAHTYINLDNEFHRIQKCYHQKNISKVGTPYSSTVSQMCIVHAGFWDSPYGAMVALRA